MFIQKIIRSLEKHDVPYVLIGGYAVALHGVVRGTIDIDIVIALEQRAFVSAEMALHDIGLVSRLPVSAQEVFSFRNEYIKNRNLIAWSFYNPNNPLEVVDILLLEDAQKMRTVSKLAFGLSIQVAAIDELIRIKKIAGRPQDLEDIKALGKLP